MRFKNDKQRKAVMSQLNQNNPRPHRPAVSKTVTQNITSPKQFNKKVWSEQELNLVMRRINDKRFTPSQLFDAVPSLYDGEGVALTSDQQMKGYHWLMKQWKTPTGKVKENSPYGSREEAILNNFKEIRFKDVYSERGNWYVPVYEVVGDDTSMEYYVSGGKINIVG